MDTAQDVYLFLHGRMDLKEKAMKVLVSKGFSNIIIASPKKVGKIGEYMAVLSMPNTDHIKLQQITKVEPVEPDGMIGLWKGVSKDEIDTIPLE